MHCVQCEAGKFSTDFNSVICTSCVAGKYSIIQGADEDFCVNCLPGKYSTTIGAGSDLCSLCPSNSFSDIASDEVADCICNKGYEIGNLATCVGCEAGKFKIDRNSLPCTDCGAGKYSVELNAIADVCQSCESGKFSSDLGSTSCHFCDYGKYQPFDAAIVCVQCLASATTLMQGQISPDSCLCVPGFTSHIEGTTKSCIPCAGNTVKNLLGDEPCTFCTGGRYASEAKTICLTCTWDVFSASLQRCDYEFFSNACPAGYGDIGINEKVNISNGYGDLIQGIYERTGTLCNASPVYRNSKGVNLFSSLQSWILDEDECDFGPHNLGVILASTLTMETYEGQSTLQMSPEGLPEINSFNVSLNMDEHACRACPVNTYKEREGIGSCVDCFADQIAAVGSTECVCADMHVLYPCRRGECCQLPYFDNGWTGPECLVSTKVVNIDFLNVPAIFSLGNTERVATQGNDRLHRSKSLPMAPRIVVQVLGESSLCLAMFATEKKIFCLQIEKNHILSQVQYNVILGVIGSFCFMENTALGVLVHHKNFINSEEGTVHTTELVIDHVISIMTSAVQIAAFRTGIILLEHLSDLVSLCTITSRGAELERRIIDTSGVMLRHDAARIQSVLRVHSETGRILSLIPVYVAENEQVNSHLLVNLHDSDLALVGHGSVLNVCEDVIIGYISTAWSTPTSFLLGCNNQVHLIVVSENIVNTTIVQDSFLQGNHYVRVYRAYLLLPYTTPREKPASSDTCAVGHNLQVVTNSKPMQSFTSTEECASYCLYDPLCTGYYYDEISSCSHAFQGEELTLNQHCVRSLFDGVPRLMDASVAATVSESAHIIVLLSDFVLVQNTTVSGYYALCVENVSDQKTFTYTADSGIAYTSPMQASRVMIEEQLSQISSAIAVRDTDGTPQFAGAESRRLLGTDGNTYISDYCITLSPALEGIFVVEIPDGGTLRIFETTFTESPVLIYNRQSLFSNAHACSDNMMVNIAPNSPFTMCNGASLTRAISLQNEDMSAALLYAIRHQDYTSITEEVELAQEWSDVSILLDPLLVLENDLIEIHFARSEPDPYTQRTVAIDAVSLVPALSGSFQVHPTPMALVHIPTIEQLSMLDLQTARTGNDFHDWERLHVTVLMQWTEAQEDCSLEIGFTRVNYLGQRFRNPGLLHRLGCLIVPVGKYGVCHVNIPVAVGGGLKMVGLVATGLCAQPTIFTATLEPYTTLWACPSANSYWDFRDNECRSCERPETSCSVGMYMKGCDVLTLQECEHCPVALNDLQEFIPGTNCQTQCILLTSFRNNQSVCQACNNMPLRCQPGETPYQCTLDTDRQCGQCPPIRKGIYSANEVWIVSDTDCDTECVAGTYNASDTCFPCSSYTKLLQRATELTQRVQYWSFVPCTATADSYAVGCAHIANGHSIEHAPDIGSDCKYECDEGFILANDTHCAPCEALKGRDNAVLTAEAYTVTGFCNVTCVSPYYAFNDTCWLCEASSCPVGEYLSNCSECVACEQLRPDARFISAGIWTADSCQQECVPGYWDDFGTCSRHSALADIPCETQEYVLMGTQFSDTMCMPCQICEGKRQTRACSRLLNAQCELCPPLSLDMRFGTTCAEACYIGRVHDVLANQCQDCAHTCAPGTLFTSSRQNCTDCRPCTGALPPNATWAAGCQISQRVTTRFSQGRVAKAVYALVQCDTAEFIEGLECLPCIHRENPAWPVSAELNVTWNFMPFDNECAWQCLPSLYEFKDASIRPRCVPWQAVKVALSVEAGVVTGSFKKEFKHIQHKLPGPGHTDVIVFVSMVIATISVVAALWH